MTPDGMVLGTFMGVLAVMVNCVVHRHRRAIDEFSFYACAVGGILGALLAVMGMDSASLSRVEMVLIMLAGYFGADVFGALSEDRR